MNKPLEKFFLLITRSDGDVTLQGPYPDKDSRDSAARSLRVIAKEIQSNLTGIFLLESTGELIAGTMFPFVEKGVFYCPCGKSNEPAPLGAVYRCQGCGHVADVKAEEVYA